MMNIVLRPQAPGVYRSRSGGGLLVWCGLALLMATGAPGAVTRFEGKALPLTEWKAVGPIAVSSDEDGIGREQPGEETLRRTGSMELGAKEIVAQSDQKDAVKVLATSRKEMVDFFSLFRLPTEDKATRLLPSFFAQTEVEAEADRDVYLMVGAGPCKVWVNGVAVATLASKRRFKAEPYNDCIPIRLKKGTNEILIKVVRVRGSCGLVATLAPDEPTATRHALGACSTFLKELIVTPKRPLAIELRGCPSTAYARARLTITGPDGQAMEWKEVEARRHRWNYGGALPAGVYNAQLELDGERLTSAFFVGDVNEYGAGLMRDLDGAERKFGANENIKALRHRLERLGADDTKDVLDMEWQRKWIYTAEEAASAVRCLYDGGQVWNGLPGLHFFAIRSSNDGVLHHYRLFVPPSYDKSRPMPVFVMVATAFSGVEAFLDSAFVEHQAEAENLARIAEMHGAALLWAGYPAQPNGNPCEFTYFDDVMQDVMANYAIDASRIYLLGTCQAAVTTTMLAERWPQRFAAVGLLDPIAARNCNLPQIERDYKTFESYKDWLYENAPLKHMADLGRTPLCVLHDDGAPGHGSIEQAQEVVTAAQSAGIEVRFAQVNLALDHLTGWRDLIEWSSGHARKDWSEKKSARAIAADKRIGPICTAYKDRFAIVTGSGGTQAERAAMTRIGDSLLAAWRTMYHGDCTVIRDVDVTEDVEASTNLVLVGNEKTNAVWRKYAPQLGVTLDDREVVIREHRFRGASLGLQAVVRHPRYYQRRLVLVGAGDLGRAEFGTYNLSVEGWCDYSIWERTRANVPLLAERYDDD